MGVWQLVDWAGTTRRRGLRPPLIELGRRLLADLPRAATPPSCSAFPASATSGSASGPSATGRWRRLRSSPVPCPRLPRACEIESGDSSGDWAAAAWEACGVAGVRRSAAFLNWRYYARPGRYYRFYRLASQGVGGGEGLAVFAFVGEEAWGAELWLPPGGAVGKWYAPLLAVAADLKAAGLRRWRFWPPPPELRLDATLAALGLAPSGERRFIGCRGALDPGRRDPAEAARGFRFAMGDYDLV